jgi:hypothetical protein
MNFHNQDNNKNDLSFNRKDLIIVILFVVLLIFRSIFRGIFMKHFLDLSGVITDISIPTSSRNTQVDQTNRNEDNVNGLSHSIITLLSMLLWYL